MSSLADVDGVRRRRTLPHRSALARLLAVVVLAGTVIAVGPAPAAQALPSPTAEFNYAEALQKAVWFYDAQRLGRLPADNRVSWRGDSFTSDGADVGLDLVGGFADAGDHIKATFPLVHSLTVLAWGALDYPQGYATSGQRAFLLSNLRWGMDYLIKAHPTANQLVTEVADPNKDHQVWAAAEVQTYTRQTYVMNSQCWGADLADSAAAAFASASMVFQGSDPTYAATLLTHARQLWQATETLPKSKYDDCTPIVKGFYNSWSGFADELVWGSLWLYRATGDQTYLTRAQSYYAGLGHQSQDPSSPVKYSWTLDWDDKTEADIVLLAKLTGNAQYVSDARNWADFNAGAGVAGQKLTVSPGGEAFYGNWGSLRYAAGAAFLALVLADSTVLDATHNQQLHDFAVRQINYILGDNPGHVSYMVGFGANSIKRPHHRTAHGSWSNNFYDPVEDRHVLYGGLVGGPKAADDSYGAEDRNDFQKAEVALDYNAGLTSALARLVKEYGGTPLASFPPAATPDTEVFLQASLNQANTNFVELKTLVYNHTAFPARYTPNLSFRYYFTLDAGVTPAQVVLSTAFEQCNNPTGPTQFQGSVYYVTISCAGQNLGPIGQSESRRENQFRLTFPVAHDYTKDWSFAGVSTNQATPADATHIVVLDGATPVWGTPPGPATPPGAPGTPVASAVTSTSVTLTWTPATPGSSPVASYDVFRVATGGDVKVASSTGLSTTVTGLTASTAYTFYVRAVDTAGSASAASGTVAATTLAPPTPPTAPGRPTASAITATSVALSWTASTAGTNPISGYSVFRVATGGDVLVATTTGATGLSTTVTGLSPATAYTFSVKAVDTTGVSSAASATTAVTTAAARPPTAPGPPSASGLTATSVTLTWSAATPGDAPLARYEVYAAGTPATLVGQTANATTTSLGLTGLTPSTAYSFFVVARDTAGVASANSPAVAVTTPAAPPATLRAQYKNNDASPTDNQIKPGMNLVNSGTSAVALSTVTIRYSFTGEAGATTYSTWCDHAAIGCANLTQRVVTLATPVAGADHYLEVGFTTGAGSLAPGAGTGEIQNRLNKTDWSAFTETNDYSFATNTAFADSTRLAVYVNGQLVWGTPPS